MIYYRYLKNRKSTNFKQMEGNRIINPEESKKKVTEKVGRQAAHIQSLANKIGSVPSDSR